MKKLLPILVILAILAIVLQFFVRLFVKEHDVKYSFKTKDNSYTISEKFLLEDKEHHYLFRIVDQNKNTYVFNYEQNFDKQEQVIQDIRYVKSGSLECIYPIYRRGKTGDVSCIQNKKQVSYSYLKQMNDTNLEKVVKTLKADGYDAPSWKKGASATTYDAIEVYSANIPKDIIFTMWFYRGIYILKSEESLKKDYLDKDQYENLYSTMLDHYYISVNTDIDGTFDYTEFYIYDTKNGGKAVIDLEVPLSKNFYFQGEYHKKLYYVDLDSKVQYSLDPSLEKIEEVGSKSSGYQILVDNKLKKVDTGEFFKEKVLFQKNVTNQKLVEKYGAIHIFESNGFYYFQTKTGDFYQVLKEDLKHPVLLFHFDQVSEWKVRDSRISIVSGKTLYYYDDEVGLRPIANHNELLYNYKNICDFAKK